MDNLTGIQDGPLFDPEFLKFLPKIINKLDPRSFVRLARTCKDMNQICFHNDAIDICFWKEEVEFSVMQLEEYPTRKYNLSVKEDPRDPKKTSFSLHFETWVAVPGGGYSSKRFKGVGRIQSFLKMVARIPFVFEISNVDISKKADEQLLDEIRQYLEAFPRVKIISVTFSNVDKWELVDKFIQDYRPVKAEFSNIYGSLSPIDDSILKSIMNKVNVLRCDLEVSDDIILGASPKELFLRNAKISIETFKELIKKFLEGHIGTWNIGRSKPPEQGPDTFVDAVAEVARTEQVEELQRNKMEPFVLYYFSATPNVFHLLKDDTNIVRFGIWEHEVHFHWDTPLNY